MIGSNPHAEREKDLGKKLSMYKEHKIKLEDYLKDLKNKLYEGHITQDAYNKLVSKYNLESKVKEYEKKIERLSYHASETRKQKVMFTVRKDVMVASVLIVFLIIVSLVYMNIQLNLAPYVVYDPQSKMATLEVNEFMPLSTIMETTVGNETKYYPISTLISKDPINGTFDNEQTLGYFVENLDIDFSEFNVTEGEVMSTQFMLNGSEIMSFTNLIKFLEEAVAPVDEEYEVTLDKQEYRLGEPVEIGILPSNANASIVVMEENQDMHIVEDLTYMPNETGSYEVNALICVGDECERLSKNFYVVEDQASVQLTEQGAIVQGSARVGEAVNWTKTIQADPGSVDIETTIPEGAQNITIYKIEDGVKYEFTGESTILQNDTLTEITGNFVGETKINKFWRKMKKAFLNTITGNFITDINASNDQKLRITDVTNNTAVYEIHYFTPGPMLSIISSTEGQIEIEVSSQIHYENVIINVDLDNYPKDSIKVYEKDTEKEVANVIKIDSDNDGLLESIRWTIPELHGSRSFIISIQQLVVVDSYLIGDDWHIFFDTTGKANLQIVPENTTIAELTIDDNVTADDIQFVNLTCGVTDISNALDIINYSGQMMTLGILGDESIGFTSMVYPNYECSQRGHLTFRVLNNKTHHIELKFNGLESHAFSALPAYIPSNISYNTTLPNITQVVKKIKACGVIKGKKGKLLKNTLCSDDGFVITKSDSEMKCNFKKLRGSKKGKGIFLTAHGLKADSCIVENFDTGMEMAEKMKNVKLKNMVFRNNREGLKIENVKNFTLTNSVVYGNSEFGIYVENVSYLYLDNVTIYDSPVGVYIKDSRPNHINVKTYNCSQYGVVFDMYGKVMRMKTEQAVPPAVHIPEDPSPFEEVEATIAEVNETIEVPQNDTIQNVTMNITQDLNVTLDESFNLDVNETLNETNISQDGGQNAS